VTTEPVLTIKDVARLLKLTEKTVYAMAKKGELPAFKIRGQWRIRREDFENWIRSHSERARPTEDKAD
jgi:excisionase family DNA binding protein